MAIELEKRNLRSYELLKRKHKKRITIVIIILCLVAICIAAFAVNKFVNKNYTTYQVIHTTERSDSNSAQYLNYRGGVIRYSRDGAMAMDGAGNLLWNGTYEMKDPIVDICEKYVAVSDRGNKTIKIFDGEGGMLTVNVLYPILKVEVANQGVVAALMDGGDVNYIELYSKEGTKLIGIRTIAQENGFPIDFTLSNDGRKVVTSYITTNNEVVQSKVAFFNFGGVGQSYVERLVGAFEYGDTLVPYTRFLNNNTVVVMGDNKFGIYSMSEIPKAIYEETFTSEIKSIFHNEKYIGFVFQNTEGEDLYRILLYDLKGKEVLNKTMNYEYDNIVLSGDEFILYSDMEWVIWKVNGKEKFHYTFDNNISYILPVNNKSRYILINELNVEEVNLEEE